MKGVESSEPTSPACPNCAKLAARVAELEALVATLQQLLETAHKRIQALEERLGQNSRNSHKPPSSDPRQGPRPNPKPPSGRNPGGQLGREGKNRGLLPPDQVDHFVAYVPKKCENCHAPLPKPGPDAQPSIRHQVADLPPKACEVTEHRGFSVTCEDCGRVNHGVIPEEVLRYSFGPRLTALTSFLSGASQVSRRQTEEIFEDVLGVPDGISLGTVSNMEAEVTQALETPHQEAGEAVRNAEAKNLDETSWKDRNKTVWMWTAATATVAYFVIHPHRGFRGLKALLAGIYRGIFTSDRWKVYGIRALRCRQICWAHLVRDFQKLTDRGGESIRIGQKATELAGHLFMIWHDFKSGAIDRPTLQYAMRWVRKDFQVLLKRGSKLADGKSATFCQNLLDLEPALWTFLRCEGVEPTNNHAERVLRRGVLWRKRSFGSRSDRGARFAERILTVVQTRRLQGKRVFPFLVEAIEAYRAGKAAPSLCAVGPSPSLMAA
jgi:transposase